ncbi:MAG: polysaccharide pyruvyl transferase family protein [Candidatus Bathyarchaeia archaeon]
MSARCLKPMSKPVRKILLINLHSSQNAGDAALLEMALHVLSVFKGAQIALAMNEPATGPYWCDFDNVEVVLSFIGHFVSVRADRRAYWRLENVVWGIVVSLIACLWYKITGRLPHWLPLSWHKLLSAYANADIVVSCPGNIFASMGRLGMPFLASAYTVAYALMMGKPLYVLPQSIGPLKRRWERKLVRYLYSRARLVFLREPVSFRLALEIGLDDSQLRLVPDLALAYPPARSEEAADLLEKWAGRYERPLIGVTVINRLIRQVGDDVWDRYERSMAYSLSRFLEEYGGTVIFFPQVVGPTEKEDDRVAAYRIVSQMKDPSRAVVIRERVSPSILKAAYGLTDIFIATRMHSAIFAISMEVPTLLIGYLHKMHGLAEMLGMEQWYIDLSEVTESALWEKIEDLWLHRNPVKVYLKSIMPIFVNQIDSVKQIMWRDICDQ